MKHKITACLFLIALAAVLILGFYSPARAGQYDVAYPIRLSGTGPLLLPYIGSSGTWSVLTVTNPNGVVQTTGSGLTVNYGPVLTSTAAIAAESGTNAIPAGTLAMGGTNQTLVYTGTTWIPTY